VSTTKQESSTALTQRQRDTLLQQVAAKGADLERVLPRDKKLDWFLGEVRVMVARTPGLLECDKVSVFNALTTCAQLGLSPSGRLGSAWLIPFKSNCTLVIGYKGYLDLAYRSGDVLGVRAQVVYENDDFIYRDGLQPVLEHTPSEDANPGPMRAVYAVVTMRGGHKEATVMWAREIQTIRARSAGARKQGGPWDTDPAEMAKKTVVRRALKMAPLSPDKAALLARAQEVDDVEDAEWVEDAPADVPVPRRGGSTLKAKVLEANTTATQRIEQSPEEAYVQREPTDEELAAERAARGTT
jgi:recombination protein RecT